MRTFTLIIIALSLMLFGLQAGQVFSPVEYMANVTIGSWNSVSNISITFTNGGSYTNPAATNTFLYRLSGTNLSGRLPLSTNVSTTFAGDPTNNAVVINWEDAYGIKNYTVEKSWDSGTNWTNYVTAPATASNYTDTGTSITWNAGNISSLYAVVPAPEVDLSGASTVLIPQVLSEADTLDDVIGRGAQTARQPQYSNGLFIADTDGFLSFDGTNLNLNSNVVLDIRGGQMVISNQTATSTVLTIVNYGTNAPNGGVKIDVVESPSNTLLEMYSSSTNIEYKFDVGVADFGHNDVTNVGHIAVTSLVVKSRTVESNTTNEYLGIQRFDGTLPMGLYGDSQSGQGFRIGLADWSTTNIHVDFVKYNSDTTITFLVSIDFNDQTLQGITAVSSGGHVIPMTNIANTEANVLVYWDSKTNLTTAPFGPNGTVPISTGTNGALGFGFVTVSGTNVALNDLLDVSTNNATNGWVMVRSDDTNTYEFIHPTNVLTPAEVVALATEADGSGSKLDSDTVDGAELTAIQLVADMTNYLDKSGGDVHGVATFGTNIILGSTVFVPTGAIDTAGTIGEIAWDATYIYQKLTTDTWGRIAWVTNGW